MSSSFDDLSQQMNPDEKRALLGRIQASLNLGSKDTDAIVSKASPPEELKHKLSEEVAKLSFFQRLWVRLAAFFRSRAEYEIMAEHRLSGARTTLRERVLEWVNFGRGELTPEFAKILYDFYVEAMALRPVFDHLFQQKITLEAGLLRLIQEEYTVAARSLDDLMPDEDIAALYRSDQRKTALSADLDRRIARYLEDIPQGVFTKVRDRMRVLYYLRPLVQFPYAFLLELFGHTPNGEPVKYPYFLGVSWKRAGGFLERFYYGLFLASKVSPHEGALTQVLETVAERISDEKTTWTADAIQQRLGTLLRLSQQSVEQVPWQELLQWCFQDPYYGVKYILPQFSVSDFYENTLLMNFRAQLEERLPRIRQQLMVEERAALFSNAVFDPLEFYVPGVGSSAKTRGFQYPESLGLLWGFLSQHFPKKIVPFYQSLSRLIPPANRNVLQGLTNVVEDLNGLRQKLQQFDRSLHPDSEEGKEFQKLKYEAGAKALGLRPYHDLLQKKDSQALELLQRGVEGLEILRSQLSGTRDRNIPALRALLKLPYLLEGQQESMENALDRVLGLLEKCQFVLREANHLES